MLIREVTLRLSFEADKNSFYIKLVDKATGKYWESTLMCKPKPGFGGIFPARGVNIKALLLAEWDHVRKAVIDFQKYLGDEADLNGEMDLADRGD